MHKTKYLSLIGLFLLSGCFSNNYYVLSTASEPVHSYKQSHMIIGVEKVTVPKYLFKREIAVAKSTSEVTFISSGTWAEDLDEGLTRRLIAFFQKKFNEPHVYEYPWEFSKQPNKKVKVHVTRFIAYKDKVYLDATWEVENMITGRTKAKLFSTSVPTTSNASTIVASMDKAFGKLEKVIAHGLK